MKNEKLYMHTNTGSIDTREGWCWFDEESGFWRDPIAENDPAFLEVAVNDFDELEEVRV